MTLAGQWTELVSRSGTPVRVELTVERGQLERAALLLGSLAPGRAGSRFLVSLGERQGPSDDGLLRALRRLDAAGIDGRVEAGEPGAAAEPAGAAAPAGTSRAQALVEAWDSLVAKLPADWSDLYVEVELDSSDFAERGALLLSPANPTRARGRATFRFRCAQSFGYGVAAGMARRCLERLDGERITGGLRLVRVLSESQPVATQGPVWRLGGRAV